MASPPHHQVQYQLSIECVTDLPVHSEVGHLSRAEMISKIQDSGFSGIQGFFLENSFMEPKLGYADLAKKMGLKVSLKGQARHKAAIAPLFEDALNRGFHSISLHLGTGMESDSEMYALAEKTLSAEAQTGVAAYVETHRGTMTQDIFRTVHTALRFPELQFTGDFSHWYTGQDLNYGDFGAKIDFLKPVWSRVRYLHGRFSHPGNMQSDQFQVNNPHTEAHIAMWRMAFQGFLADDQNGKEFYFCPELIAPPNYAPFELSPAGKILELGDRWLAALHLKKLAKSSFSSQ